MSTSFSVRAVSSDGNPRDGVRVMAHFGVMHGFLEEYTNSSGWAEFTASGDYVSVELFVDGENMGEHGLSDGDTFSFAID